MSEKKLAELLKAAVARRSPDTLSPHAAEVLGRVARWKKSRTNPAPPPEAVWCVVANVAELQAFGDDHEMRRGTKHFSPNTKVYCFPPLWGDGYEKIKVIGRHRGSSRLAVMVVPRKRLTNWRVKLVRHPFVVAKLSSPWSEEQARSMVATLLFEEAAEQAKENGFQDTSPDDELLYAARLGLLDHIEHAFARGANIHARRTDMTALCLALVHDHLEAVQLLVARGADTSAPCGGYESVTALAQRINWTQSAKFLGAKPFSGQEDVPERGQP